MTYFINFEKFFKQKYALLISFAEYYGFPETEIFFSENLLFALYNEVFFFFGTVNNNRDIVF